MALSILALKYQPNNKYSYIWQTYEFAGLENFYTAELLQHLQNRINKLFMPLFAISGRPLQIGLIIFLCPS